jgi:RNA polymerase sigma-70 factor (ECF subfamily)
LITDEQKTLEAIRNGDESAFRDLFDEYYGNLCNYLKYYIMNHDEVEDQVQEVFVNIWRARKNLPDIRSVKGYLFSSAKNKLLDYNKHLTVRIKASAKIRELFSGIDTTSERDYEQTEMKELLDNAIRKLPPRRREVFVLVKINGMSYQEAADVMGINKKTIEGQLSMAIKTLREILAPFIK